MKKTLLFSGAAVIALLSAGCRPEMAQGVYGAEEKEWQEIISSSYSGYRPPRIASPATADKASPEALEKQRAAENRSGDDSVVEVPPPAAEDKAPSAVDRAADKTAQNAEDKKADAAKAGDKKAEDKKAEAAKADDKKAEDKKADAAKADDKKADDKKADAAKADDKKAEDKKADAAKSEDLDYEIYKVQPGDTPGSIARKYYGKASMYEIIMRANPQIKDAKLIQIGTELKIPKL